jgi:serine/arginine repetitive matrix protein 1
MQAPDPRDIQINITGFLESKTKIFMKELWSLLISAQNNIHGIPTEMLEQKKQELEKERREKELISQKLQEDLKRRELQKEIARKAEEQLKREKAIELSKVVEPKEAFLVAAHRQWMKQKIAEKTANTALTTEDYNSRSLEGLAKSKNRHRRSSRSNSRSSSTTDSRSSSRERRRSGRSKHKSSKKSRRHKHRSSHKHKRSRSRHHRKKHRKDHRDNEGAQDNSLKETLNENLEISNESCSMISETSSKNNRWEREDSPQVSKF